MGISEILALVVLVCNLVGVGVGIGVFRQSLHNLSNDVRDIKRKLNNGFSKNIHEYGVEIREQGRRITELEKVLE